VRKPIVKERRLHKRESNRRYRKNNPHPEYSHARNAKGKAEREAKWLLEHPALTLADRERAVAARRRRLRQTFRRPLPGRPTCVSFDLGDFDDMGTRYWLEVE
jgi:hypothetical protein